jgi:phospholipid/cholesterol/gamma-HCH transport system substrate-binding protein
MMRTLITRHRGALRRAIAAALLIAVLGTGTAMVRCTLLRPTHITAYFTKAIGIYPGDNVEVAGVTVGHIEAIDPQPTQVRMTLTVDHGIAVPANATAVIAAQNLVAARYVELTPAYEPGHGPTLGNNAVIPLERTAVPVEWDQVKDQLMRLSTELGNPHGRAGTSISRFIDSTATALAGNGAAFRQTLAELSKAGRILASSGGDLVAIITNLETFVTALKDSNTQIVEFQDRFATLTSVIDESRSDLDNALTGLSDVLHQVQHFIAGSRDQTTEQVQRLANVTQNLVEHHLDLENLLHVAPNSIANGYNIYNPDSGSVEGTFVMTPLSNTKNLICGAIGAVENVTAAESSKLCNLYLGPTLEQLNINGSPVPINPYLGPAAKPDRIIYTDPALAPGGAGPAPRPPEQPPTISAYSTGTTLPQLLLPGPPPAADARHP